jgi:hypothetical protein
VVGQDDRGLKGWITLRGGGYGRRVWENFKRSRGRLSPQQTKIGSVGGPGLRSTLKFLFAAGHAVPHGQFRAVKHFAKKHFTKNRARNVNGFWAFVCQDVPFRAEASAENPIDCRIFFADNPRRKTESGIGGKNP